LEGNDQKSSLHSLNHLHLHLHVVRWRTYCLSFISHKYKSGNYFISNVYIDVLKIELNINLATSPDGSTALNRSNWDESAIEQSK
jgi:hypothetical protein